MKISKENFETMRQAILAVPDIRELLPKHREFLRGDPRVKDLEKRLRWDCFAAAKLSKFASDVLYKTGLNDEHIDTALRKIVAEIES